MHDDILSLADECVSTCLLLLTVSSRVTLHHLANLPTLSVYRFFFRLPLSQMPPIGSTTAATITQPSEQSTMHSTSSEQTESPVSGDHGVAGQTHLPAAVLEALQHLRNMEFFSREYLEDLLRAYGDVCDDESSGNIQGAQLDWWRALEEAAMPTTAPAGAEEDEHDDDDETWIRARLIIQRLGVMYQSQTFHRVVDHEELGWLGFEYHTWIDRWIDLSVE